jgi:glutathione S-transferase
MHAQNTGKYRKAAQIPYPNAYASAEACRGNEAAFQFNCAQRSHANFTEHHLTAVGSLLIAGLQFPIIAAGCGLGWTLSRMAYMWGYSNSKLGTAGKGRYNGVSFWMFELGLLGMAVATGVKMIMGN